MEQDAEIAVKELRLFISRYEGVELRPDSRIARQLEVARKAVAGYDEVQRRVRSRTA